MKLIFYFHDGNVEEFLSDKRSVIIGRGKNCDIILPYEGFSRQHAEIEYLDGEIFITDLGSTNGVYIDGNKIPSNIKTKMQSFLTLQIGPASRIEVQEDSPVSDAFKFEGSTPSFSEKSSKLQTTSFDSSRPNNLKKTLNSRSPKSNSKSSEKPQSINPKFIILTCLVVFAVFYFQMDSNEDQQSAPEVSSSSNGTPEGVPLTEISFLPKESLESQFFQKSCDADKASWCASANLLGTNFEGVVFQGRSLILYYNMNLFKEERLNSPFDSLTEEKKMEGFLLRRVFTSSVLRILQQQTQFDNFQAIAGYMGQEQFSPIIAIKINRDANLKNLDKFTILSIFDLYLNQGATEELSKISSVYESMPLK